MLDYSVPSLQTRCSRGWIKMFGANYWQGAVIVLGMPLDPDTISHIYGLIGSGDNRLTKADFIKSFQAFILKEGVRLMQAPAQPSPRLKQKVVQLKPAQAGSSPPVLCFPFKC